MAAWKALIIEDEDDSAEVVKRILAHHDINFSHAFTAEDALIMLAEDPPDVFIVDLRLPGMSGWEFLEEVRSDSGSGSAYIPAVAVTAYHSISVAEQALEAGFAAYFPKPITVTSFAQDVSTLIGGM